MPEPRLQLKDKGTVLFSDYIKQTRQLINPNFQPIFAAVSHLTLSVHAPPPTNHHRDVWALFANQINRLVPAKRPQPVAILNELSFYARPGEMTLILGAPGTRGSHDFDSNSKLTEANASVVRSDVPQDAERARC